MEKRLLSHNEFIKRLVNESNDEIVEALGSGSTNARPDSSKITLENRTIELGKNLFKLGSDKIDTNSEEFKKAKSIIENSGAKKITIQGGASSVGSKNKFDNQGLADRRANNFKTALKNAGFDTSKMEVVKGVVTPNTDVPNSDAANKAQFVRFTMTGIQMGMSQQTAVDNVATARSKVIPIEKIKVAPKYYIDVRVTYPSDKSTESILGSIKLALKNMGVDVKRINN
jgi:outer membrane protein OmpA-like peptidoglycan-associated protein